MGGTYGAAMGDRGRLVVPAELRERAGWSEGTHVVFVERPGGVLMLTRPQLRDLVRGQLAGHELVEQLLADRRAAAATEDGG